LRSVQAVKCLIREDNISEVKEKERKNERTKRQEKCDEIKATHAYLFISPPL